MFYDIFPGLLYENYLSQGKSPEQELKQCPSKHLCLEQKTGPIVPSHIMPIWDASFFLTETFPTEMQKFIPVIIFVHHRVHKGKRIKENED